MNRQMKMAFMQEGGEVERDPVSGNEVPIGSFPEEVRDDVPAMLSEGEYVVPADVLRFYGLKFFEDLRDKAKMALAKMEQNGRIGGEPMSPSIPDAPTVVNKGGVIEANNGTMVGGTMTNEQIAAQQAAQAASMVAPTYTANIQQPSSAAFQAAVSAPMGGASNVGTSGMGRTALFVNPTGLTMQILVNEKGEPLYGAPPGYVLATSDEGKKRLGDTGVTTAPEAVKAETPKKKKDLTAAERAAKADATRIRNENALKTSAGRLFGLENENDPLSVSAANLKTYEDLSFTERVKLIPKEFDKDVLSDSDKAEIEAMANNKSDGSALSTFALTLFPWLGFFGVGKDKTPTTSVDEIVPATSSAFKGKISKKDKPYTTQRKTDSGYIDTVDLSARAAEDKDDFSTGTGTVYRDKEGKVAYTDDAVVAAEEAFKEDTTAFGNKGMLVTKPKRKPRVKRKSLGQK